MNFKKNIAIILILLVCSPDFFAQENKISGDYVKISGSGLMSTKLQGANDKKLLKVLTLGGFITIKSNGSNANSQLLYKTYFKESEVAGKTAFEEKIYKFLQRINNQFFLKIGQDLFVDIINTKTNSLLKRYQIKRIRKIPKIQLDYSKNNLMQSVILTAKNHAEKLIISPNETIGFKVVEVPSLQNLDVTYTLTNLKTRKSIMNHSKQGFNPLKLAANTDYELRYNYAAQPESVGVYYFEVRPYWYQSPKSYIILIVFIVLVGFLIIGWFFRNRIRSSEKKQQKIEQAALRLQSLLNPHFTFNALSTIQGLMNTNHIEEANYYLQEFSSLLRETLIKSQDVFNSLDQEIEMMKMYIRLEALRFNFSWDIQISPEIDTATIEIPTLLLQPLIENSIKHGLSGLGKKGKLLIICRTGNSEETIEIVVKDNGNWKEKSVQSGYGLSLTNQRIATINKFSKEQKITLNFVKQLGTEAILTFYNWNNK